MAPRLLLVAAAAVAAAAQQTISISFNASTPLNVVDRLYLNYNIDTGSLFNGIDFFDPKFRALSKRLGPAILRVGGTAVDYSFYQPDVPYIVGQVNGNAAGNTVGGAAMLDALAGYAEATGFTLLYDFNGLSFRGSSGVGPWDPTGNATAILDHFAATWTGRVNFSWAMGNEPDLWKVHVPTAQLGADAVTLQKLVTSTPQYAALGSEVYGSSFASINSGEASQYLPVCKDVLHGLTVHDYPYARGCTIQNYLDKTHVTESMAGAMQSVVEVAKQVGYKGLLVVEETAGSYGGGCENITDRFASGFAFHPILNAVAWSGFQRMHRQDIAGWSFAFGMSHYQLAGPPGWTNGSSLLTAHPDYFLAILFKQLQGTVILSTNATGGNQSAFDVHVWCASSITGAPAGSISVAYTNLQGADVTLTLGSKFDTLQRVEYTLTSTASAYEEHVARMATGAGLDASDPPASLADDAVYLNGAGPLAIDPTTGELPAYPIPGKPVNGATAGALSIPPYSYGFAVYLNAGVPACM